jgi:hypothetical protein
VGKPWQIAANHSQGLPQIRLFTFMKNDYSLADEQEAAGDDRMLLWWLLHHPHSRVD